ncbi:beta/gamma crystallin-related protein, partial [Anabaena sp. UHCC 0204]|uniref:beta/gamma crystallin-related protein n=1 Tax=Anabaena sp. UHCC 0204 TaxID=2590009 RepID=UPI0020C1ED2F
MFELSLDSQQSGTISTPLYNHLGLSDYQDPLSAVNPSNSSQLLPVPSPIIDTVTQSIDASKNILSDLSNNSHINEILNTSFGQDYQKDLANQILTHLAQNNFTGTPDIQLVSTQSFNGAYAKEKNTIYLSQEFVAANSGNVGAVAGVLLEEFGHYIDGQINVVDAVGDEGNIFSLLVRGQSISAGELLSLKTEDDHGVFVVVGLSVGIEKNVTVYEHDKFGGAKGTLSTGSYELGNTWWNDKISSISIAKGWVIRGYEHSNFGGQEVVWTSSTNYVGNNWNDKISSLRVYQTDIILGNKVDFNGDGKTDFIRQEKGAFADDAARMLETYL